MGHVGSKMTRGAEGNEGVKPEDSLGRKTKPKTLRTLSLKKKKRLRAPGDCGCGCARC